MYNIKGQIDLSIIIVNWNTKNLLKKCLTSIVEKTKQITYEIIVIDNNSHDGSVKMLNGNFNWCHIIVNKKNVGFSKANNKGLSVARGRYIIFLNPDTELVSNAMNGMVKFLDTNEDFGAIGCKLLNDDGSIQFTCARTFPTLFNQLCHFLMLNRLFPKVHFFSSEDIEHWDHNDSREVDVISGACMMVRREILNELEGFDETTFMYAEDVDLCFRIKKNGKNIYYLVSEEIIHHSGSSSSQNKDKSVVPIMLRKAHYHFIKKHYGKRKAIEYRGIVFLGSLFRLWGIAVGMFVMLFKPYPKLNNIFMKHSAALFWSIGLIDRDFKEKI